MVYKATGKSRLGKSLEHLINLTNQQYANKGLAYVHNIPTPVNIIKASGNKVIGHKAAGQFVDYIGVSNGLAIAFDAKQTRGKSLPLSNIPHHQVSFLEKWSSQGAFTFLLVEFVEVNKIYMVTNEQLQHFIKKRNDGGRKSIPLKYVEDNCEVVTSKNGVLLDYLHTINKLREGC